jgi:AAA15 family ATPase/GTPase
MKLKGQDAHARILYFKRKEDFYLNYILPFIKEIDLGIKDIKFNQELFSDSNWNDIFKFIDTVHTLVDSDGTQSTVELNITEESEGTRKFFLLALELAANINSGIISLKDELDGSLHPLLCEYIIKVFHSSNINPDNYDAQLIFTTHDTNLLNLDLFRRDQIWFTEKNPDTGATDLYSLYDFGNRKDVNVEKGYLLGVYGAIPFLGGTVK